jgi:predicted HAD superfamily Cof-like phosphohydrolase
VKSAIDDVTRFHHKFGHPVAHEPVTHPKLEEIQFRRYLHDEEDDELDAALDDYMNGDVAALEDVADGIVDSIYVRIGTALLLGIPLKRVWDAVQRANLEKEANPSGGKPIKPAGWKPPDIAACLWPKGEGK